MKLCTIADLYNYLGEPIPEPGSDQEQMAELLIEGSSAYFRQQCNRPILTEEITEKHNGHGFDSLRLRERPIVEVISVTIDGEDRTADIDHDRAQIFLDYFPVGRRNIEVTYRAGLGDSLEEIPQDVRLATVLLAHFRMKTDQMQVPLEYQEGPVVFQHQNNFMPREVRDIIRRYRRLGY